MRDIVTDIRSEGLGRVLSGRDGGSARPGAVQHGFRGARRQSGYCRKTSEGEHDAAATSSRRAWNVKTVSGRRSRASATTASSRLTTSVTRAQNHHFYKQRDNDYRTLVQTVQQHCLVWIFLGTQLITFPTRGPNVLDILLTNAIHMVSSICCLPQLAVVTMPQLAFRWFYLLSRLIAVYIVMTIVICTCGIVQIMICWVIIYLLLTGSV